MKTEKRIFILLDILGGTFILRSCCMMLPGFIMMYRMYLQIQNMVCNIPLLGFQYLNNACMSFPTFIRSFSGFNINYNKRISYSISYILIL